MCLSSDRSVHRVLESIHVDVGNREAAIIILRTSVNGARDEHLVPVRIAVVNRRNGCRRSAGGDTYRNGQRAHDAIEFRLGTAVKRIILGPASGDAVSSGGDLDVHAVRIKDQCLRE